MSKGHVFMLVLAVVVAWVVGTSSASNIAAQADQHSGCGMMTAQAMPAGCLMMGAKTAPGEAAESRPAGSMCCGLCSMGPECANKMKDSLGLSDQQAKTVTSICEQTKKDSTAMQDALQADQKALHDLIWGTRVDEAAAKKLVEKIGREQTALSLTALKSHLAIRQVLTPEQRAKWSADGRCSWLDNCAGPRKAGPGNDASAQLYTCPMHTEFVSTDPNALCPKCNMKLVPAETKPNSMQHDQPAAQGGGGMGGCPHAQYGPIAPYPADNNQKVLPAAE